ncbi:MAG TPA: AAA family ATPase [Candidatus Binataceae bacterium]|nr:AAA family ATPase [Candidatus Binataceae bacterium]
MDHDLNLQVEITDYYYLFEAVAGAEIHRRKLRHLFRARFGYVAAMPAGISNRGLVASEMDRKGRLRDELREWDGGLVVISTEHKAEQDGHVSVYGFFAAPEAAQRCLAQLSKLLPPEIDRGASGCAVVSFWNAVQRRGDFQAERESKSLRVPRWHEIASNYPERLARELDCVMQLRNPQNMAASRLMLWRGLPGTGKTWAVRALAREWAAWCNFHYVIDPAVFFRNASYMLSLLSKVDDVNEAEEDNGKWNLLVLEDAGEFVAMDARQQQHGQALAKLLNLTDGLFGQGLRLIVLITTNEEMSNLHPAIVRNGRCLTNLCFEQFSPAEAQVWLNQGGAVSRPLPQRLTLSDLYAVLKGDSTIENAQPHRAAGFIPTNIFFCALCHVRRGTGEVTYTASSSRLRFSP